MIYTYCLIISALLFLPMYGMNQDGDQLVDSIAEESRQEEISLAQQAQTYSLIEASRKGLIDVVRYHLEHGAAIDEPGSYGRTALHWAAQENRENCIRILLERGAAVDTQDDEDRTALHYAANNGHEICARLLLESGAEVDIQDNYGTTPCHMAAHRGREKCLKVLLAHGAAVDAKDEDGGTALHWAAISGHEGCARVLLEYEAEVDMQNNRGKTALLVAASLSHQSCVKLLLEEKANIFAEDAEGHTPLYYAVQRMYYPERRDQKCVDFLLAQLSASDTNVTLSSNGKNYLLPKGHARMSKVLSDLLDAFPQDKTLAVEYDIPEPVWNNIASQFNNLYFVAVTPVCARHTKVRQEVVSSLRELSNDQLGQIQAFAHYFDIKLLDKICQEAGNSK